MDGILNRLSNLGVAVHPPSHLAPGLLSALLVAGACLGPPCPAVGQAVLDPPPGRAIVTTADLAPTGEFVDVDGIRTHFVARGEQGPAIVLIHGFASNTYTWRKTLDGLSGEFRVFALDLKGFGLTEKPKDGQYHTPAFTRHLLGFLDAMHLGRPVLVGSSMGGSVALQLALAHPDRVAGLVLVDSAPPDFRPTPELIGLVNLKNATSGHDGAPGGLSAPRPALRLPRPNPKLLRMLITRSLVARGLRASFRDTSLVTPEMVEVYYHPATLDGAMEALADVLSPPAEAFEALDDLPALESLGVPTLIVWGRHDAILPVAMADLFARRISGSTKVIFDESGHLPHEEQSDEFNDLLARFAREVE